MTCLLLPFSNKELRLTLSGNKTVGKAVSTEADGVAGGLGFSTETDGDDVWAKDAGMFDGGCCFFLMVSL